MLNIMKKILLVVLIFCSLTIFAQQSPQKVKLNLNAGSSLFGITVNTIGVTNVGDLNSCFASPVGHFAFEYFIDDNFSIGLDASYQYFNFEFNYYQQDIADAILHRANISIRAMYRYINTQKFNCYSGLKFGRTGYLINARSDALQNALDQLPIYIPFNPEVKTFASFFSGQLTLFGVDYKITNNFGLNAEICLGPTYTCLAGLSFHF